MWYRGGRKRPCPEMTLTASVIRLVKRLNVCLTSSILYNIRRRVIEKILFLLMDKKKGKNETYEIKNK